MLAKKYILSFVLAGIISIALIAGVLWNIFYIPKTNSFNSSYTVSANAVTVGELYNSSTGKYNNTNIGTLMKLLSNSSTGTINTISSNIGSSAIDAGTLRGYSSGGNQADKSIVITLGGYTWLVTYLSKANGLDTNGDGQNDVIATLWLTGDQTLPTSTFGNNLNYYGVDKDSGYPTAMYGTSYIRAKINNGGSYIKITSNSINPTSVSSTYSAVSNFEYAAFLSGGVLNDIVVQPKYVSWQESGQSTKTVLGWDYNCSNESWSKNISDEGFYSAKDNYADKTYSDAWKEDFLWLPSLTETGYSSSITGMWDLSVAERSNSQSSAWLRTSHCLGTTHAYYLLASGGDYSNTAVYTSSVVRIAFHLNLSKIATYGSIPVTLDKQGGSGGSESIDALFGEAMPTITIPTRTGYTFGGYYTSTNGGGTQYYNASGTSVTTFPETGYPTTLYAKWTGITYYVSYNGNNATNGSMSNSTHTYGTAKNLTSNAYSRTGYSFLGWSTSNSATTATYTNGQSISNLTTTSGATVTLYAVWKINPYTITIQAGEGGVVSSTGGTYNYGETLSILAGPNVGKAFLYWLRASDGAQILQNPLNQVVTANETYTAVFGASVEGIAVASTKGGVAYYIADDFESLADTDTITFVTKQVLQGYSFSHWVDLDGNNLGTEMSIKLTKAQVMDNIITAVYVLNTNNSVNTETSN